MAGQPRKIFLPINCAPLFSLFCSTNFISTFPIFPASALDVLTCVSHVDFKRERERLVGLAATRWGENIWTGNNYHRLFTFTISLLFFFLFARHSSSQREVLCVAQEKKRKMLESHHHYARATTHRSGSSLRVRFTTTHHNSLSYKFLVYLNGYGCVIYVVV